MVDTALLLLRGTLGGFMMGHGGQKLFGWFGGGGMKGTEGFMEALKLRPNKAWAMAAGWSEFGGGLLTTLGLLGPIGPISTISSMATATRFAHWGKPIWVTTGGAELPVTNMSIASALMLTGPGKISLDEALDIHMPRWMAIPGVALAIGGVGYAVWSSRQAAALEQQAGPETAEGTVSPASEQAPQAV